jgi:hypothetical protein
VTYGTLGSHGNEAAAIELNYSVYELERGSPNSLGRLRGFASLQRVGPGRDSRWRSSARLRGRQQTGAKRKEHSQEWLCPLWFADFGAGLRQLFNRGLQAGAVFYVEDADGTVDLAE